MPATRPIGVPRISRFASAGRAWPILTVLSLLSLLPAAVPGHAEDLAARLQHGAVLFAVAGCATCHTDTAHHGAPLAGGRALKTGFGTFYTPNISSDPQHGIGKWSDADFLNALRHGVAPSGARYYPAFPYPSYTLMTDGDVLAIKAYIMSLPPQPAPDRPHDLGFPFNQRWLLPAWQILYLREGPYRPRPDRSAAWNRGAYLARAIGHCTECHTPRTALGATISDARYGGTIGGPSGLNAPDITPDPAALGPWSEDDIARFLQNGMTPDGDFAGGAMALVVKGTSRLSDADRHAIAIYLKSVPPLPLPARPTSP